MFHVKHYDVIVVGGGHAGCEAADAAARLGVSVVLVTMRATDIGVMSCNPAIGGLGKGHLVREVDALGGVMGQVADVAGIQFRLLNRSKGPAVQGPRAQADRVIYAREMQKRIRARANLDLIEAEIADITVSDGRATGVVFADGSQVLARAVILTTGTFLGGVIHIGRQRIPAGRADAPASDRLARRLRDLGLVTGRLKTGTPPRLDGRTIDWAVLDMQPGDEEPTFFSFLTRGTDTPQLACGITETSTETHDIIRRNLDQSAVYSGEISGTGPRYCPSIEDKVTRFADKESHQVFLEPEGLTTDLVYPNGLSTSLPAEIQEAYIRSIRGLGRVDIVQPGYAIEYDFCDPKGLALSLEVRELPGLFLAGQINGTTGYEEAAAQGLVAGLNAARSVLGQVSHVFSRTDSYLGVLLDDLTTRGVSEPYRMFTSRAEFRLSLRADNADQRLTSVGRDLGLIADDRWSAFEVKMEALAGLRASLAGVTASARDLSRATQSVRTEGPARTALECLEIPSVQWSDLASLFPQISPDPDLIAQVKRDAQYRNYIERQKRDVEALKRDETVSIPVGFDYDLIEGLSNEIKGKLISNQPKTLAQAARIEGVTPAALLLVLSRVKAAARAVG